MGAEESKLRPRQPPPRAVRRNGGVQPAYASMPTTPLSGDCRRGERPRLAARPNTVGSAPSELGSLTEEELLGRASVADSMHAHAVEARAAREAARQELEASAARTEAAAERAWREEQVGRRELARLEEETRRAAEEVATAALEEETCRAEERQRASLALQAASAARSAAAEASRKREERGAREAAEAQRRAELARLQQEAHLEEERVAAELAAAEAEALRLAELARAEAEAAAEEAERAEQARLAEAARQAELAVARAEQARLEELARRAQAAREAEAARVAQEAVVELERAQAQRAAEAAHLARLAADKAAAEAAAAALLAAELCGFLAPGTDRQRILQAQQADATLRAFDGEWQAARASRVGAGAGAAAVPWPCPPPEQLGRLRAACVSLCARATAVALVFCAPSHAAGVAALKAWVAALGLPRGKLRGADARLSLGSPLTIKFSSAAGDAHCSPYGGDYRGVLVTPSLPDLQTRTFGYLPLYVFDPDP